MYLMSMSPTRIASIVISLLLVIGSSVIHEIAHGWVALKCGDPTAKEAGRLTLDPRAHFDGFGSLILPLIMALMGGPVFGFARPVPYNPNRLKNPGRDDALVALAGPVSNLLQALVGTALVYAFWHAISGLTLGSELAVEACYWTMRVLTSYVYVNLVLAVFNLIPLPPLDGSKLVLPFLRGNALTKYYRIQQYSMPILICVVYLVPTVLGIDPVGWIIDVTAGNLYDLLLSGV